MGHRMERHCELGGRRDMIVQQVNNFIRVARGRNVYKRFLGYVWEKGGEIKFTKP